MSRMVSTVVCILLTTTLSAVAATASKRVLLLYSFGRNFSPYVAVASTFQTELAEQFKQPIEFHEASLEAAQFTGTESDEPVVAYLQALFARREPDLVVPFGAPAVRFVLRQRARLFPSVPLLIAGVEERFLKGLTLDTNTTAVTVRFDLPGIVQHIMRVWPATTNLAMVLGNSPLEVFWKAELEREFKPFTNRLKFTWLDQFSLEEMQHRLSRLPPKTIVFFAGVHVDAAGVPYEQNRALTSIHAVANAPIVGMFDTDLGFGIVGGPLLSLVEDGRVTAEVAIRVLNGEPPSTIQAPPVAAGKPVYDWRELKRWGIHEAQLPPGSEVRFLTPTFAEQYRWRILAAVGICLVEAALIVALVSQLRQRRRTEQSLRESEGRMKLAAGAAELGIWEWNLVTHQIWATGPTATRLRLGESGRSDYDRFLQCIHPDDRNAVKLAAAKSMNGGGDYESVHRVVSTDGQTRWIAARGRVEFNAKGQPALLRGVSFDITARKEAEERAQESERRFLLLANSAPMLIWASGRDKLCNFFNEPWLRFTGRRLDQELGHGWAEGVHPDDLGGCLKVYTESFDARSPFTMEYRLRRHDGQYRWLSDHGVPRYDAQQNFLGYIGSCVDVTAQKQAEAELQETRRELAHVSRVSTLGELAGSLAHELNQPLTAILSNVQAAQRFLNGDRANLDEVREILKDVVEEDRRAGEVIVRMRAMLKKGDVQMAPQDLNDLIAEVVRLMRSELVVRNVSVVTDLAPGLPLVRGDRIQLQQVLLNLIMNACEAMSASPAVDRRLTLATRRVADAGRIEVMVTDQGPGFAPEALQRIYQPFATTKANGLGMGLAICRSIIDGHGGRLWVGNNDSRGATARFTLEVHEEKTT